MTEQIEVAISSDVLTDVHKAVSSGEFESTSQIVEQALRSWNADRMYASLTDSDKETIGRMWDEAMADHRPSVTSQEILGRVRERYRSRTAVPS